MAGTWEGEVLSLGPVGLPSVSELEVVSVAGTPEVEEVSPPAVGDVAVEEALPPVSELEVAAVAGTSVAEVLSVGDSIGEVGLSDSVVLSPDGEAAPEDVPADSVDALAVVSVTGPWPVVYDEAP